MTIKIGTGSSAIEPSVLRMGNGPAKKVMVGTGNDAVPVWVYQAPPMEPLSFSGGRTAHPGYANEGTLVTFYVEHGGMAHVHVNIDGPPVLYHWENHLNRYFGIMTPDFAALRYWTGPNPPDTPWIVDEVSGPVRFRDNTEYTIYLRIDADEPIERYLNSWSIDIIPVAPAVDTSTVLTVSPTEAAWGDPVTLTATVTPSNAVGSVTFDGAEETSTVSLVDGVATTTRTFYAPGEYEVSAEFTPTSEDDFLPSSDTSSITVVEGAPQVVEITGTLWGESQTQFRDALTARGLDYTTVTTLPFALDTSQATELNEMFSGCTELTEAPEMDTSNVTEMISLFNGCSSLTSVPEMDTSNVTDMRSMFSRCESLTSVPEMDTSNVTNMQYMFAWCTALAYVPDMDTSNVTNMGTMFTFNPSLTEVPEMDTSNVTDMSMMFSWCSALTYVPDMDTSNVTNMRYMFEGCGALTDGNVRLFGRHPDVETTGMIDMSGLTVEPFFTPAVETSLTLTSVPSEITEGESITLTATVTPTDAVGSVTFAVAGETSVVEVVEGVAATTLTVDQVGTHEVTADFIPADADDFLPSVDTTWITVHEFIPAVETTTTLSVVPNEITEGEQVILTATVTPNEAVGEVTFTVGTQTSTVALVGGAASSTVTLDTPGAYDVTADFIPSSVDDFTASSATGSITVLEYVPDPVETTTTLTVDPEEIEEGESVTVTATVTPVEAAGVIEFDVAGQLSSVNVVNGEAITTATLDEAGDFEITADFIPTDEADFLPSSDTGSITVVEASAGLEPMEWSGGRVPGSEWRDEYEVLRQVVQGSGVADLSFTLRAGGSGSWNSNSTRRFHVYINGIEMERAEFSASSLQTHSGTFSRVPLYDGDVLTVTVYNSSSTRRTIDSWSLGLSPLTEPHYGYRAALGPGAIPHGGDDPEAEVWSHTVQGFVGDVRVSVSALWNVTTPSWRQFEIHKNDTELVKDQSGNNQLSGTVHALTSVAPGDVIKAKVYITFPHPTSQLYDDMVINVS